jgi:hypothetical protein
MGAGGSMSNTLVSLDRILEGPPMMKKGYVQKEKALERSFPFAISSEQRKLDDTFSVSKNLYRSCPEVQHSTSCASSHQGSISLGNNATAVFFEPRRPAKNTPQVHEAGQMTPPLVYQRVSPVTRMYYAGLSPPRTATRQ